MNITKPEKRMTSLVHLVYLFLYLFVSRERGRDGLYHAKAGRDSILHTEHGA